MTPSSQLMKKQIATSKRKPGWQVFLQAGEYLTTHAGVGLVCLLHCAKMREGRAGGNFLPERGRIMKLTTTPRGIASTQLSALCLAWGEALYEWSPAPDSPW
jgi:hypothetical protein